MQREKRRITNIPNFANLPIDIGILPVNSLYPISILIKFLISPIKKGIGPLKCIAKNINNNSYVEK